MVLLFTLFLQETYTSSKAPVGAYLSEWFEENCFHQISSERGGSV